MEYRPVIPNSDITRVALPLLVTLKNVLECSPDPRAGRGMRRDTHSRTHHSTAILPLPRTPHT